MRRMNRGGWVLCAVWLGGLGAASFAGCGPSGASICEKICDCVGCSDSEREDCVDEFDDAQRDADQEECSAEWNDFVACIDEELECDDDRIEADGCDNELEELAECADGEVSFGGILSPCGVLKEQCGACGEATELCEATVDLVEEVGGNDACQDLLNQGGVNCGGGPGQ